MTSEEIITNGLVPCDRCEKVPEDGAQMRQVQGEMLIFLYCFNCWFKYGKKCGPTGRMIRK